jgi:hypothetical protein
VTATVGMVMLAAAFAVSAWSGRAYARRDEDQREVAAILALGAVLLGAVLLGAVLPAAGAREAAVSWPEAALGFVMAAGLLTGYVDGGGAR